MRSARVFGMAPWAGLTRFEAIAKELPNEARHRDVLDPRSLLEAGPESALDKQSALH
jgi:hypothetical protein